MADVRSAVIEALVEVCGLDRELLIDAATLTDLGVDSMDILEVGAVVEQRLGVEIDLDDVSDVSTLGDAVELFARLIAA